MPTIELLTSDDLDRIGQSAFAADEPLVVAADLVHAVEAGRVADDADVGNALSLAAEISERAGDLEAALTLAERAVEANREHISPEDGYPRAFHAGLLLRLGRVDEAMAELTALRPLLTENADAVLYVSKALEAGGRAGTAAEWLTAALETALERRAALAQRRTEPAYEHAAMVAFALIQQRHWLRRELDLPHDEHDHIADQLMDALFYRLVEAFGEGDAAPALFWPRPEFDRLLARWPVLARTYGRTWDEHRTNVERELVVQSECGHTGPALLAGSVDELVRYADERGGEPTDPELHEEYHQHLEQHARRIAWPPARNEPCWCRSGLKYKKCCLPRSRA